ncbi:hypothetical protein [Bacillus sp. T33-2]|uniref:hypothetical protein n=1 Tax=Bacillus sp. T33-2 TaxID=2054168 RepID=UPI000C77FD27|nr:hypothetical protein [Bacillus sp. T33-2]PLR98801.1 hypothetical protein CVD19_03970 [Bacillus sp. T33-2]
MNIFRDNMFYKFTYKNKCFSFLQFIRMDMVCDVCYVTLKNVLTGEMFTFDQSEIDGVQEICAANAW